MSADAERLTLTALNRALLARQGLLERLDLPLAEAVEAIGAPQAQHWPALPIALWSRVKGFAVEDLYGALERQELVLGTLLRRTLHLVSAREHAAYAAIVSATGSDDWRRTAAKPSAKVGKLRARLLSYTREEPRSGEQIAAFIEEWMADHPDAIDPAELERQRALKWRPFLRSSSFVRAPADGHWGAKAPAALRAAPQPSDPSANNEEEALKEVIRRHLRGFGPAGAEDVASWLGLRVTAVREALKQLAPELAHFEDESGRALHDLPEAPRPDAQTPAPVRLLAPFDSVLLAYDAKRRQRILPDAYREAVYERANLRILPCFLLDGLVAGTWSMQVRRREATVTLAPFTRLPRAAGTALVQEATQLARAVQPDAKAHGAVIER